MTNELFQGIKNKNSLALFLVVFSDSLKKRKIRFSNFNE